MTGSLGCKPSITQFVLTGECLAPRRFSPTADPRCFASLRCMVIMVSGSAGGRMTVLVRLDVNRRARVDQWAMPRSGGACRRRGMGARIREG